MKKTLIRIAFFTFSILTGLFFLYSTAFWAFIEKLSNSEEGLLISLYNEVSVFFRYSDTWNLIFIIIFISFAYLVWIIIEIFQFKIFKRINIESKIKNQKIKDIYKNKTFQFISFKAISINILFILIWAITNIVIIIYSGSRITKNIDKVEKRDILLLGTSKYLSDGKNINLYYKYRIDAVVDLYKNDKIKQIIISGDKDKHSSYNEPRDMKNDLVNEGIDSTIISLDYAGYRTLDSILRLASLFKTSNVTIVSQKFHIERALFQSFFYRINATGYQAKGTMTRSMLIRELMAKPKVILDLFFFNMQPKLEKAYSRSSFSVSSDLHVIFLVLIIALIFSVFSLMGKLRLKVLYFSLGTLTLTIIIIAKLYQKTIFTFFSDLSNAVIASANTFNTVMQKRSDSTSLIQFNESDFKDNYQLLSSDIDSLVSMQLLFTTVNTDSSKDQKPKLIASIEKIPDIQIQIDNPIKEEKKNSEPQDSQDIPTENRRKRTNNSFNAISTEKKTLPVNPNIIFAIVPRSKEIMHNSYIDFITQKDYIINGTNIPKNTTISLLFTVDNQRMYFTSKQFYYKGKNLKVNLDAIELDNQKGIKLTSTDKKSIDKIIKKDEAMLFPSNYKLKIKCTYL